MSKNNPAEFSASVIEGEIRITLSQEASDFFKEYSKMKDRYVEINKTEAGAIIALTFIKFPWLTKAKIELAADSVYDDQGSYCNTANISVHDIGVNSDLVEGYEEEMDDQLLEEVEEFLRDYEIVLHEALSEGDNSDVTFSVVRQDLEDLLTEFTATKTVSGNEVLKRVFPVNLSETA